MMVRPLRVLFWLEDQPQTVADQIEYARNRGFEVEMYSKPFTLVQALESSPVVLGRIFEQQEMASVLEKSAIPLGDLVKNATSAIVIDIMLFGVRDLSTIEIWDSDTDEGYEAGWVFLDLFVRHIGSPYLELPVLVLSFRPLDPDHEELLAEIQKRGGAPITFIEKYSQEWSRNFSHWVDSLG